MTADPLVLPKHLGGNDRAASMLANTHMHNTLWPAKLVDKKRHAHVHACAQIDGQ